MAVPMSDLNAVLISLAKLAESAHGARNNNVAACAHGALLMLLDGASDDGMHIDTAELGFMVGIVDG